MDDPAVTCSTDVRADRDPEFRETFPEAPTGVWRGGDGLTLRRESSWLVPPAYELAPKDDVTPLEAVRIAELLAMQVGDLIDPWHVGSFIERHGLGRHFEGINQGG